MAVAGHSNGPRNSLNLEFVMTPLKIAVLSFAMLASASALAEGGSDRLKERSDALAQVREQSKQQLAGGDKQKTAPDAEQLTGNVDPASRDDERTKPKQGQL